MSGSHSCMFAGLDSLMYMYMDFYSYILALQIFITMLSWFSSFVQVHVNTFYVTVQDVEHTNGLLIRHTF